MDGFSCDTCGAAFPHADADADAEQIERMRSAYWRAFAAANPIPEPGVSNE